MNFGMRTLLIPAFLSLSLAAACDAAPIYTTAPGYNSGGTADQGSGGMYMLNIGFNAVKDGNGVVTGGGLWMVAQAKTIILALRPVGSFDPNAAWGVLEGTAYSRRLGWNPDPNGTLANIPAGDSIWIQWLSGSPEVKCYFAQDANCAISPNPITHTYCYYGGMFGAAGSGATWQWDQKMDHNAYAVNLGSVILDPNQTFTATYRLFIGDANGNEVLDANSIAVFQGVTEVWTWTSPAPVLEPTSMALLTLGGFLLARRKRR